MSAYAWLAGTGALFVIAYLWSWWMILSWAREARSQDLRERIARYCE